MNRLRNISRKLKQWDRLEMLMGLALVQLQKAIVAYGRRDPDQARELLASSKMLLGKAGIGPGPDDKFEIEWLEQQLRRWKQSQLRSLRDSRMSSHDMSSLIRT